MQVVLHNGHKTVVIVVSREQKEQNHRIYCPQQLSKIYEPT